MKTGHVEPLLQVIQGCCFMLGRDGQWIGDSINEAQDDQHTYGPNESVYPPWARCPHIAPINAEYYDKLSTSTNSYQAYSNAKHQVKRKSTRSPASRPIWLRSMPQSLP